MDNNPDVHQAGADIPVIGAETDESYTAPTQDESNHQWHCFAPCESSGSIPHIGGASSSDPASTLPSVLHLRPTTPPRGTQQDWTPELPSGDKGKGKTTYSDPEPSVSTGPSHLVSLPPELIDSILSYLSPADLVLLSATCRLLYTHATADRIWQAIVQSHVPGIRVTVPYPFQSFLELFKAHDPYWFVPKHKIWFSDGDLAGRLILARYDQRRGCIEAYQLVAVSNRRTLEPWQADREVMIHAFEPEVKLHLDKPILHLAPVKTAESITEEVATVGRISMIRLNRTSTVSGERENRFQTEIPMDIGSHNTTQSTIMLARPLDDGDRPVGTNYRLPYATLWPPPAIPARHRVAGTARNTQEYSPFVRDKPSSRREASDQVFRIRKWLQMWVGHNDNNTFLPPDTRLADLPNRDLPLPPLLGVNIGEEVSTYATLDPELYTPTPEKPYRGIWVGDYSGHGCEFLLINQPDDPDNPFDPNSIVKRDTESDEDFAQRKHDETVYRGRLEAIKLTGDPNVPRGEYTFVADDIGEKGFLAVVQHEPFVGTRVVKSKGHIAHTGFVNDRYIESQLLLISHNRLAQYWVGFGHISFFERVDIDQFLVPE